MLVPGQAPFKLKGKPGCISWYGKMWGNLGSVTGPASIDVDSVMEGNCIWRRSVLASLEFDPVLNFDDASMYGPSRSVPSGSEESVGCRVIYDPRALVYHHVGPRAPELDRQERRTPDLLLIVATTCTYIISQALSSLAYGRNISGMVVSDWRTRRMGIWARWCSTNYRAIGTKEEACHAGVEREIRRHPLLSLHQMTSVESAVDVRKTKVGRNHRVLIIASHPMQYSAPIFPISHAATRALRY